MDRQAATGLALALAVGGAWLVLHVGAILWWPWDSWLAWTAPFYIALQTWLSVGLFIVAHDAMHRSLAPGHGALCDAVGTLALFCYGGFAYERFRREHLEHHRSPGTVDDPDFHRDGDRQPRFWRWFGQFIGHYVGTREVLGLLVIPAFWALVAGAPLRNVLLFWAVPAVLSAVQLFRWGTYLPHRPTGQAFVDAHRAHPGRRHYLYTLATCFHFGIHHEHHLNPGVPWWRLPSSAAARAKAQASR